VSSHLRQIGFTYGLDHYQTEPNVGVERMMTKLSLSGYLTALDLHGKSQVININPTMNQKSKKRLPRDFRISQSQRSHRKNKIRGVQTHQDSSNQDIGIPEFRRTLGDNDRINQNIKKKPMRSQSSFMNTMSNFHPHASLKSPLGHLPLKKYE